MFAYLSLLILCVLTQNQTNPHDQYNLEMVNESVIDADFVTALELMHLLTSQHQICHHTDTYVSTFRWPGLETIGKLVYDMRISGWRISLEEIDIGENESTGLRKDTDRNICMKNSPLFLNGKHICLRSINYYRSVEQQLIYETDIFSKTWTRIVPNCPRKIHVIHFKSHV